jgi:hypothetical protein
MCKNGSSYGITMEPEADRFSTVAILQTFQDTGRKKNR